MNQYYRPESHYLTDARARRVLPVLHNAHLRKPEAAYHHSPQEEYHPTEADHSVLKAQPVARIQAAAKIPAEQVHLLQGPA